MGGNWEKENTLGLLQLDTKSSGRLGDPSEKTPPPAPLRFRPGAELCSLQKAEPWIDWVGRKNAGGPPLPPPLPMESCYGKGCSKNNNNKYNFYIKKFCTFLMQCGFTGKLCYFYNSFCTLECLSCAYCSAIFISNISIRPCFRYKENYSKLGNSQNSRFKLISGLNMGTGLYTSFYIKYSLKEVE